MNRPAKLLMIDDSRLVHRFLDEALIDEGLEHIHAYHATEGWTAAIEQQPDLILLDVVMPEISGFDLCHRLKNDPRTSHIPVIFLSGAGDSFNKVQGLDLGAVDYVVKPFDNAELQARVRTALRSKFMVDMLSEMVDLDALTGLRNRRHFDRRLNMELQYSHKGRGDVSLLLIDVDHFKRCNDSYGHPFGDRVLRCIADVIRETVREIDVVCRYGGEEFGIILPDANLELALIISESLRTAIAAQWLNYRGQQVQVTISGGLISTSSIRGVKALNADQFVQAADAALYRAKQQGRNCILMPTESIQAHPLVWRAITAQREALQPVS